MNFIKIKCNNCGNIKEIFESEKDMYLYEQDKEHCFICGGEFKIINEKNVAEKEISIAEIVYKDLIEGMKRNILLLGNNKVWGIIEGFENAETRLKHRQLFLKADGKIPINEIKL